MGVDERTDRHDQAHSPFSQFCERAIYFKNFIKKKRKKGGMASLFRTWSINSRHYSTASEPGSNKCSTSVSYFGGHEPDLSPPRGFRQSPLIMTTFPPIIFKIRISTRTMCDCNVRLIKYRYMNKETYIDLRYTMCFL
jgi:hypothetical protein